MDARDKPGHDGEGGDSISTERALARFPVTPNGQIMSGTALIFGISGQDGSLLARHLLIRGWTVHGTSRDAELNEFANLNRLGIRNSVTVHSANPIDFRSAIQVIERTAPDHVYNLGGQSSVGLSF